MQPMMPQCSDHERLPKQVDHVALLLGLRPDLRGACAQAS